MKNEVKSFHFELTSVCNLRCSMCPTVTKREARIMDMSIIEKVLKETPQVASVGLNNWGEPFLHPRLLDIIKLCDSYQQICVLSTNATHDLMPLVGAVGLHHILFSVDGMHEAYEKIRKIKLQPVIENIMRFLDANRKSSWRMRTTITCTVTEENKHDIEALRKFWAGKADYVYFQPKLLFSPIQRKGVCNELNRGHLVILSDGYVVPCCVDYNRTLAVGHILKNTLDEIYNGYELNRLRELQQQGTYVGACKICSEYACAVPQRFN